MSASQDAAITDGTRAQHSRSWARFKAFTQAIGLSSDPFLQGLRPDERVEVFTCYAAALREGWTRDARRAVGPGTGLQASTVRAALDGMVQTDRAHQLGSPIHDARGQIEPVLAAQLKGYSFDDPEVRQAPAIPARVVAIVASATGSELHLAMGQLTVGAFFFAMRACEYSETNGRSTTRTVTIGDDEFRKGSQTISSMDERCLSEADTVSVTYRTQKNGDRGTTVTQYRAENHRGSGLCPVKALAKLKARVMAYNVIDPRWPSADNRPINLLVTMDGNGQQREVFLITSGQVLHHLKAAAAQYGEAKLGFPVARLGTHSLRSGAALAMYLAGVPAETMQLIGRWKSQAFLRYIRLQVQQLTQGVATEMTTNPEFFTIRKVRAKVAHQEGSKERQGARR